MATTQTNKRRTAATKCSTTAKKAAGTRARASAARNASRAKRTHDSWPGPGCSGTGRLTTGLPAAPPPRDPLLEPHGDRIPTCLPARRHSSPLWGRAGTRRRFWTRATTIRGLLADTRPLRNAHFRRLWPANIVTVVGAQLTVVAVPGADLRRDRLLGVRRADRRLRPGAAGRLRALGRRAGRRDRPAHAAGRHHGRPDR